MRHFFKSLKTAFHDALGLCTFPVIRQAERHLSVQSLYAILRPWFLARAAVNVLFKQPKAASPLPACLDVRRTVRLRTQQRATRYLNNLLKYFPERLATSKWIGNCQFEGLSHLLAAREAGRPVVLAFCHLGPFYLLPLWLRAAGLPAAAFVAGEAATRSRVKRRQDLLYPLPDLPVAMHKDELREAAEFLGRGNILVIAIDIPTGKQMDVPFGEGWTFQMATGALRLAGHHQAELMMCSITDEGRWRFRLRIGRPVPREHLTPVLNAPGAARHLLEDVLPALEACPDQCSVDLTRRLKRALLVPQPNL